MKEKEIIKSEKDKLLYVYSGVPLLLGVIFTICVLCDGGISAWFDYASTLGIETIFSWGGLLLIALGIGFYFSSKSCEIFVTDKRITGTAIFGNRVDIPVDSVTAIGAVSLLKGITVSSPSGFIRFFFIANYNQIHKEISDLILKRTSNKNSSALSGAEELKKFKDLLDSGAITQEEFDKKKKELLDL